MTDPAPAQATPPAAPAVAPPAQAPVPAAPPVRQPAAVPQGDPDTIAKLQADLATWKDEARKHEARWKTRDEQIEKQDAALKLIAEKAGIDLEGKPDPEKLATQLAQVQQQATQRAVELAVYRAAATAGANADLLLDSRAFMAKAAGLDPSSPDFADRVKEYAADAVKTNPTLGVTQPQQPGEGEQGQPTQQQPVTPPLPASSGGDFSGAPHTVEPWTEEMARTASLDALEKAIQNGQLAHMGVGPARRGRRH